MLGVDKGADAALFLFLSDDVQRQRRLAGAFRPVDLDDAPFRQPADAEPDVETERSGRDRLDIHRRLALAELHDRALAKVPLNLRQRAFQRLRLVHVSSSRQLKYVLRHCGFSCPVQPKARSFAFFLCSYHCENINGTENSSRIDAKFRRLTECKDNNPVSPLRRERSGDAGSRAISPGCDKAALRRPAPGFIHAPEE